MFDKFKYTVARMLDAIYHMTLKLLKNRIFGMKHQDFAIFNAMSQCTSLLHGTLL